ncbi:MULTISPECIES: protein rep [unclassified Bradyrhizobium]|uniref:protein rep n=1 Tax=unclassified Bradyrhizobium TaxID=2631580 RepID=UPI001CD58A39|nr:MULTISPECIES: protein rep [unclassified Bradyrhizobium]MCA1438271.1 hypothetical protein [Bradyrhizobium sp. BRP20]MCA1472989.1 hypothetical protein [Bradyrhizobium sp. IC3195]MCA1501904.1 hypothetical protein [Bradyrhizobium sp. NBAIM14]MCA1532630.1 hypothetical protein [Bradyrhizobium sp. NBAIM03]
MEGKPRADYDPMVRIEKMRGGFAPLTVTGRKSLQEALKYCFKPGAIFYTKVGGSPAIVGCSHPRAVRPQRWQRFAVAARQRITSDSSVSSFFDRIAVEPSICG